jgi:beta-glucosidase
MSIDRDLAHRFPPDFVWGVATSSFQIEGAAHEDGKGESIWDRFCRVPGAIADGSHGDLACDHYHRLEADLDLIAGLGVDAYRFSVSWPRVQPDGRGAFNEAGLAFYERLVDGLLARGIRPYLTLNHWDLPQALQDAGGWAARETVHHFVAYARHVAARMGDRVAAITTHNEPWVIAVLGHESGIFAPGIKSRATAMQVAHHLLLSHGLAVQALRADGCRARLGIVLNLSPIGPATDSPEDAAAAWLEDGRSVRWYMDPLFKGEYPPMSGSTWAATCRRSQPGDGRRHRHADGLSRHQLLHARRRQRQRRLERADQRQAADRHGLGGRARGPDRTAAAHAPRLVPAAAVRHGKRRRVPDTLVDGRVHDADRTDYIASHIAAVGDAMDRGVPMAGYMVWSLMDNFEWASGYAKRFGIVHVDYATLQRTPKDSYRWYRGFLQQRQLAHRPTLSRSLRP